MPDLESSRPEPNHGNSPGPHHGYDPNQPRVPSGHGDGGQWTKTPGGGARAISRREAIVDRSKQESWGSYVDGYRPDGSLAEQRVFNRDGSRIVSEFNPPEGAGDRDERHTVVLPDGTKFTFENSGNVQRIFDGEGNLVSATEWTEDGPRPVPIGQLAFAQGLPLVVPLGQVAAQALNAAALTFFTWLSSRKDPDRTAVFAFNAKKYEKPETDGNEKRPVVFVGSLTRDEVRKVCDKLPDVQKLTDAAVAKVTTDGDYKGPADFGTKVHKEIADAIRKENDPDFKAEKSVIKTVLETGRQTSSSNSGNAQEVDPDMEADYGELGSIRIDAYENVPKKSAVCVYDPKTGWRGLSFPRMNELAAAAHRLFGYKPNYIIVIEVRPGQK
ncbi:MAG TPA: hypothetical protein VHM25_04045 [Polyangiaceae bacterium]|jgi:hypothetical protein|nr:hypothetical protein [Polyangiaceae bacterium]